MQAEVAAARLTEGLLCRLTIRTTLNPYGSCKCFLFLLAQTGSAVALNSLAKNKKHSPSPCAKLRCCVRLEVHIIFGKIHSRRACFAKI